MALLSIVLVSLLFSISWASEKLIVTAMGSIESFGDVRLSEILEIASRMLLAKTKSSTAIFIAAVLPSIILVATGHIPIAPLVSIPAGIIALLIAKNGNYEDFKKNAISHLFFSLNLFGGFIPIWVMREAF